MRVLATSTFLKHPGTFGKNVLSWRIERGYEAVSELRYVGECVELAALIDYADTGFCFDD